MNQIVDTLVRMRLGIEVIDGEFRAFGTRSVAGVDDEQRDVAVVAA
jgi:hypothetical protein